MFKIRLFVAEILKKMWPKVTLYALLSVATATAAILLKSFIPHEISYVIEQSTISSILNILASSMLAVTTFSLSTMVAAWGSATSNVTPRATRLLMQDSITQNVLATFIGSFVFSLVGIICLGLGVYDGGGRLVLFATTIVVILLILATLIRWIEHLSKLGRVGETTRLVEKETRQSLKRRAKTPFLGGSPLETPETAIFEDAHAIPAPECGYVKTVDMERLSELTEACGLRIYVTAVPGTFVGPNRALVRVEGELEEKDRKAIVSAFILGDERSYEQDPRFGLCVLSEIASRSAPSNDWGTVIDVIGRLTRVFLDYANARAAALEGGEPEPDYPNVFVPGLDVGDMFNDAFNPIARDAAGIYEVQARLQKAFATLHYVDDPAFRNAARKYAAFALERVERCHLAEEERRRLREDSIAFGGGGGGPA